MMHVNDATSGIDASNSAEDAPSLETSKKSEKKCRMLCNPQKLPESAIPQPNLIDEKDMDYDTRYVIIKNFFCDRQRKANKKARDRGWI